MLEPRRPRGETGADIHSQVREENSPGTIDDLPTAENLMQDRTQITGLAENAELPSGAVSVATSWVSADFHRMTTVSHRHVISHIKLSRERESVRLCQSLGSVLNTILNPPGTITDLNSDFRETSMHFENASDEDIRLIGE